MVASPTDTPAQETKNEIQIKDKGQSKVDAIHQKVRTQKGAHSMRTDKQCHHKQAKETTVFVPIPPYTVGHHTRIHQPNLL
jgi:hypothetical protein